MRLAYIDDETVITPDDVLERLANEESTEPCHAIAEADIHPENMNTSAEKMFNLCRVPA